MIRTTEVYINAIRNELLEEAKKESHPGLRHDFEEKIHKEEDAFINSFAKSGEASIEFKALYHGYRRFRGF